MKTSVLLLGLSFVLFLSARSQQAELVKDINPGEGNSFISYLNLLDGKAVFKATNSGYFNDEPWVTDGTESGTIMLREINPDPLSGSFIGPMVHFNNEIYFQANDGIHGSELWKTDGTPGGTTMVIDLFPGSQGSNPGEMTEFNGELYFSAYTPEYGDELWKTQGDSSSTTLVADIAEGDLSSSPCYLFPTSSYLFFARENANGVYRSDGTPGGTGMLYEKVIIGQLDEAFFTLFKGDIFFRGTDIIGPDAKGTQLWKISGDNVIRVTSLVSPEADLDPMHLTVAGDLMYFIGEQYPYGEELWIYNGTQVQMVKDINPSGHGNLGGFLTEFRGKLVFSAGVASTGVELWVSDGTEDGTRLICDIYPGPVSSGVVSPVKIGDTLYLSADDGTGGEIWKLPSPEGQLSRFTNIPNGGAWGPEFTRLGDYFLFSATDATSGTELWKMKASGLGIENAGLDKKEIVVYPNPARNLIHIEIPSHFQLPAEVRLYNSSGSKFYSGIASERTIQLSAASFHNGPGIYFLKINDVLNCQLSRISIIK